MGSSMYVCLFDGRMCGPLSYGGIGVRLHFLGGLKPKGCPEGPATSCVKICLVCLQGGTRYGTPQNHHLSGVLGVQRWHETARLGVARTSIWVGGKLWGSDDYG